MKPSLSTSIGPIQIERPTMLASGILGISLDVFNRIYKSGAGAVVTKSLSKEPWEGYPNPTIFSVKGLDAGVLEQLSRLERGVH
ncbi:MAG: dihydroorotate dehydrogenase, partial [Nitrosopumilales archaeon]|nr:dihydroorotate dehydrogenase [Nitrosopumilales archaeon]